MKNNIPKWVNKKYDKSCVILAVELTIWHRINKHKIHLIADVKRAIRKLSLTNITVKSVTIDWDEQELRYNPKKGWPKNHEISRGLRVERNGG